MQPTPHPARAWGQSPWILLRQEKKEPISARKVYTYNTKKRNRQHPSKTPEKPQERQEGLKRTRNEVASQQPAEQKPRTQKRAHNDSRHKVGERHPAKSSPRTRFLTVRLAYASRQVTASCPAKITCLEEVLCVNIHPLLSTSILPSLPRCSPSRRSRVSWKRFSICALAT